MKTLISFSGGMDSATLVLKVLREVGVDNIETISFDYGSKHNDTEFRFAKQFCRYYGIQNTRIDLKGIFQFIKSDLLLSGNDIPLGHYADPSMRRNVVPFRNGIMLSILTAIAESKGFKRVGIANHFGDHTIYPDCRESFIKPFMEAVESGTYGSIELYAPFSKLTKKDIIPIGLKYDLDYSMTYSCYQGTNVHCGECGACVERREAFELIDVVDPTSYKNQGGA